MKKTLSLIIAVIITLSSLTLISYAETPNISMIADTTNVNVGDVVTVTVKVAKDSNLCSVTLDVIYDKECFEVVKDSMHATEVMGTTFNENYAANKARYVGTLERFLKNEANLFSIQFKVLKRGGNISIEAIEVYHIDDVERKEVTTAVNNSLKDDTISIACPHTEKTTETTDATCSKEGKKVETCKECGHKTETVIAKLAHTPKDIVTKEATCKEAGEKAKLCTVCNEIYDKTAIPALPHNMKDIVIKETTCNEEGIKAKKCVICGYIADETYLPRLPHEMQEIIIEEATCIKTGKKIEQCRNCNYRSIEKTIPILPHTMEKDVIIQEPSCTEPGIKADICSFCDKTTNITTIQATGHNYKNGKCVNCGEAEPINFTFEIQEPSTKRIRCKDGIILHTKITGKLPKGAKIEWSANNSNFNIEKSADGTELTIISKDNGYTTFTAILCDADGNELAKDSVEMYSKSGFFDKIGGFFRGLFGLSKIYEN